MKPPGKIPPTGPSPIESPLVCGIDEAGRGPLAGPVTAAAVILPPGFPLEILDDSKKLKALQREKAAARIYREALAWGLGWVSAGEIDKINILQGSLLAMTRAFEMLSRASPWLKTHIEGGTLRIVVDGTHRPPLTIPCEALVKADAQVPAVMAASILAKTARDSLMDYYGLFFPGYGYEKHRGYGTKGHREALARLGPSPIQRMSFRYK
ncbi:MAG: ribonuclease HII [Treponema sp.]|nr:ribonuclease HII [Treponema sp.]